MGSIHCHGCQTFDAHTCRWPSTCGILSSRSPVGLWQRKVRLVELRTILHCSLSIYTPQTNIQTMDNLTPSQSSQDTLWDVTDSWPPSGSGYYSDLDPKDPWDPFPDEGAKKYPHSAWRLKRFLRTSSLLTQLSCCSLFPWHFPGLGFSTSIQSLSFPQGRR